MTCEFKSNCRQFLTKFILFCVTLDLSDNLKETRTVKKLNFLTYRNEISVSIQNSVISFLLEHNFTGLKIKMCEISPTFQFFLKCSVPNCWILCCLKSEMLKFNRCFLGQIQSETPLQMCTVQFYTFSISICIWIRCYWGRLLCTIRGHEYQCQPFD